MKIDWKRMLYSRLFQLFTGCAAGCLVFSLAAYANSIGRYDPSIQYKIIAVLMGLFPFFTGGAIGMFYVIKKMND